MSLLNGPSASSGSKNWIVPLAVVLGVGLYSWRARRAEASARRDKFEKRLGESHRRDSIVFPRAESSTTLSASPPLSPSVAERVVPPLTGLQQNPSSSAGGPSALGRMESVVLSPMDMRDWSIRLFPDSLSGTFDPSVSRGHEPTVSSSPSGSHTRAQSRSLSRAGERVHVGALTLQVRPGFAEQPSTYSFPMQTVSFVHPDGSRLCIMAEELTAMREPVNTVQYVNQSVERLRTAAQEAKTYFKVKLNAAASMIVTTIMERYVSIQIGPSPSIAICFFLVHDGVAYTVQLQCQPEEYESRLADILMAVQTARLDPDAAPTRRGHNCYTLHVPPRTFVVHLPTELVVHQNPTDTATILLTHAHSATWNGEVRVMTAEDVESFQRSSTPVVVPLEIASSVAATERVPTQMVVPEFLPLIQGELYVYLNPGSEAEDAKSLQRIYNLLSTPTTTWAELTEEEPFMEDPVTALVSSSLFTPCFYISSQMHLPLPPVHRFTTQVCEHLGDWGVTLFIRECTGDLFEMELRIVTLREEQLSTFTEAIDKLFIAPVSPRPTTNAAGQRIISAEGLAASGGDVTLRLDCVQVNTDNWLIIRWLFDDSNMFTRELDQYKERLYDTVFVQ